MESISSYFEMKSRTYRSAATRTPATVPERLTLSRGRPMFRPMGPIVLRRASSPVLNPTGITNEGTICRAPLKFQAMQMKVFRTPPPTPDNDCSSVLPASLYAPLRSSDSGPAELRSRIIRPPDGINGPSANLLLVEFADSPSRIDGKSTLMLREIFSGGIVRTIVEWEGNDYSRF